VEPADIARTVSVANPVLSPDGATVAFVVTRVDEEANRYRSAIWLAAVDGSTPPRPITDSSGADHDHAWSPDGTQLAFTRSLPEKPPVHRLHVLPVDGPGELRTLAEGPEPFGSLEWSPDGSTISGAVRVRSDRYAKDDERAQPPRHIENLRSRLDNEGWVVDRRRQVFVVPADGLTPLRQVTSGPYEHNEPRWAPDGSRLVLVSARHDDWDLRMATDLFLVDPSADEPELEQLTDTRHYIGLPSWSPDGRSIAALAADYETLPRHTQVVVLDLADRTLRTLTEALDRECAPTSGAVRPAWVDAGRSLLFSCDDHGDVPVYKVAADGSGAPERVLAGERWITGFSATDDAIAFTATDTTTPVELFAVRGGGPERQLTKVQDAFIRACPPIGAEQLTVPSPAGDVDLDVWLMRPPGFEAEQRYPMLLIVHGGPMAQYGNHWFDEVQLYASAGHAVVFTNPHGATGGTEAFVRSIRSPLAEVDPGTGWGGIDFDDLMAVVSGALAHEPAIDPDRVGIIGGSYGGYIASWAIGHTNRFAAAVSERAVNNLLTLEWTSDLAGLFRLEEGVDPIEQQDEFLRQSPITYTRDIETPVLILHSENDLRCPIEQADQLFTQLRLLAKPCDYYRFPAEGHELSRSGSPAHRIQRAEIILDWFSRHLKP
jgi:dipeptidyl aminopeptidase/acylaminoacyl peptidase